MFVKVCYQLLIVVVESTPLDDFHNEDLTNIVTPVNVNLLESLLIESQYDKKETDFIVEGFRNGFDIG